MHALIVDLARVGDDGAILNPVYLVTARIIRDQSTH